MHADDFLSKTLRTTQITSNLLVYLVHPLERQTSNRIYYDKGDERDVNREGFISFIPFISVATDFKVDLSNQRLSYSS